VFSRRKKHIGYRFGTTLGCQNDKKKEKKKKKKITPLKYGSLLFEGISHL